MMQSGQDNSQDCSQDSHNTLNNTLMKSQNSQMIATKTAVKATFWYLVCDFVLKSMAFLTMPLYTRILSVADIGNYAVLNTWVSFFSVTVTLNLTVTVVIAKFDFKDEYNKFLSTIAILGVLSASLFYVAFVLFQKQVSSLLGLPLYALHAAFVCVIFCQGQGILLGKYRANLEYKKSVVLSLSTAVIVTVISLICTITFTEPLHGRILGSFGTNTFINIIIIVWIIKTGKTAFTWRFCKYALMMSIPMIIHNLSGNIMASSDKIMIKEICSAEDVGIYGVAYTCGMFVNVLRNSMNSTWYPWFFEQISTSQIHAIKKASYFYLSSFFIICVFAILIAPEMLLVLGGKTYLQAKDVVPPIIAKYMFAVVYSLYAGVEQYYKEYKCFASFTMICAVVNIVLNFIFIPLFGYLAAAYTTMFCEALLVLLHYNNVKKMNKHKVFNTKCNAFMIFLMTLLCLFSKIFYSFDYLRYSLFVFILVVIVFFFFTHGKKFSKYVLSLLNIKKG